MCVKKGLAVRAIEILVKKLKAIALHFSQTPTDIYLLESKQKILGVEPTNLINNCPTHWNYTYLVS